MQLRTWPGKATDKDQSATPEHITPMQYLRMSDIQAKPTDQRYRPNWLNPVSHTKWRAHNSRKGHIWIRTQPSVIRTFRLRSLQIQINEGSMHVAGEKTPHQVLTKQCQEVVDKSLHRWNFPQFESHYDKRKAIFRKSVILIITYMASSVKVL